MNYLNYRKAIEKLCIENGFTISEAERLYRFRKRYRKTAMDTAALNYHYLEFIRWLVLHGRLTG
jgi:hypothetical protein